MRAARSLQRAEKRFGGAVAIVSVVHFLVSNIGRSAGIVERLSGAPDPFLTGLARVMQAPLTPVVIARPFWLTEEGSGLAGTLAMAGNSLVASLIFVGIYRILRLLFRELLRSLRDPS